MTESAADTLWRWSGWALMTLFALILILPLSAWLAVRASLPSTAGERHVAGLSAPVTIRFDAHARPYVRAATFGDALQAQGYLHATQRLWQMELFRRSGRGRLAEALGASLLETDRELWRAGVPRLAERIEANATPQLRAFVEKYVAGVNAGIASLHVRPPEFLLARFDVEPWTPADVYAAGAVMAFDSANNYRNELLRLALSQALDPARFAAFLPDESQAPQYPYVIPPRPMLSALQRSDALDAFDRAGLPSVAFGSNGWAVAPARTRERRPLFAFDSHDALALPNLFYEVHLFFGEQQVRGWSVAGLPGVINGFNRRIAWGFTNIGDTQDLFLEVRDPDNPLRFRSGDEWYAAQVDRIDIPVKGRASERLEVIVTRNGRLISDEPPIALRWTGQDADAHGLDALLDMNTAENWTAFRAAIDRLFAPSANMTYADVDGHIAFRTVGRLPIRGRGLGLVPLAGDDPRAAWRGYVPMDQLPMLFDPAQGYVAAANARVTAPSHPVLVSADNATRYRIERIQEVLAHSEQHDVESMRALQTDWLNGQARALLPELLEVLDRAELSIVELMARSELHSWRRRSINDPNIPAPLIFERWWLALAHELFAAELGPELYERLLKRNYMLAHSVDRLVAADRDSPWWNGEREQKMLRAFQMAVRLMRLAEGADLDRWAWGRHHRVHFEHELGGAAPFLPRLLNRGPYAWGGGTSTVGRGNARYDQPDKVDMAATVRVVADMAEPIRAFAVIPGGQSGHFLSEHYDDQIRAYLSGELFPLSATPDEVRGELLTLAP